MGKKDMKSKKDKKRKKHHEGVAAPAPEALGADGAAAEMSSRPGDRMKRGDYEKELEKLQVQLCYLQEWLKVSGHRCIVVLEGRDAAGKGGTIKAITARVSPRVFRVVALPAPSDREKSQMLIQRYFEHFPAAGELVIFDRSWYNRAGVDAVMGFAKEKQVDRFLKLAPRIESYIIDGGIQLIKFWLEVGMEEQQKRFQARIEDPLRQWKLSPMDLEFYKRWYEYSRARDRMLTATDTQPSPWHVVRTDDKRRGRLNLISHLLKLIPYEVIKQEEVTLPDRSMKNAYDDDATMKGRRFIPEVF